MISLIVMASGPIGTALAFLPPASLGASGTGFLPTKETGKMKRVQQGFTLIELMIVVAIVGILAAIALPAYQDFIVRSKMSEAMAAMAACKTSVSEYASSHAGTLASSADQAGCSTTPSQYLASLTVTDPGVITTITTNTGASAECTLMLTPVQITTFEITSWTATFATCPSKYVPSSFR